MAAVETENITISRAEYDQLQRDSDWLRALEQAGVDNWEWYGEAQDLYESWQPENDCE
ncbi:hypothetical protein AUR04nite_00770 [Glutamicibacter uratoxydans]|uniref:Uncharacterized protein n=1 Tax=Glutamicibacter uratoxydans TaxID=43667 RepID=A0A4Y4DLM3_GLUUR|nr:hypothetical protein [Glutamicibacter uratoxydans]GED04545.1 hypothetical protein AUR04nite_00770 [Glutamicibacter uratoxydans]